MNYIHEKKIIVNNNVLKKDLNKSQDLKEVNLTPISFVQIVVWSIGAQVGSGAFLLPALLNPYGSWALWSLFISGLGACTLSRVFSLLMIRNTSAQGPCDHIQHHWGKNMGCVGFWSYWAVSWFSSIPLVFLMVNEWLYFFYGPSWIISKPYMAPIYQSLTLTLMALLGSREFGTQSRFEFFYVGIKILVFGILPLCAFLWLQPCNVSQEIILPVKNFSWEAFIKPIGLCLWGFFGLECPAINLQRINRPKIIFPRALMTSVIVVTLIYVLNIYVMSTFFHADSLNQGASLYGQLLERLTQGMISQKVMSFLIVLVIFGTLSTWTAITTELSNQGARMGAFPRVFAHKISEKSYRPSMVSLGVPWLGSLSFVALIYFFQLEGFIFNAVDISVNLILWIYLACCWILMIDVSESIINRSISFLAAFFCCVLLIQSGIKFLIIEIIVGCFLFLFALWYMKKSK